MIMAIKPERKNHFESCTLVEDNIKTSSVECVDWTDMSEGRKVAGAVNTIMQRKVLTP